MLNAGVIGKGVSEKHALAYENHKNIVLKTVCDFDHGKLKKLNTKFPNVCMETKDQSILENEDIDIVSIASFDNYHCDQIVQVLNNGKHVMAEKPLCMNKDEMEKIQAAHKQDNGVRLSANPFYLNTNEPGSESIPISEPYPVKDVRQQVIHSFVDSIQDSTMAPLVTSEDVYDVMSACFAEEVAMNTDKSKSIEYLT